MAVRSDQRFHEIFQRRARIVGLRDAAGQQNAGRTEVARGDEVLARGDARATEHVDVAVDARGGVDSAGHDVRVGLADGRTRPDEFRRLDGDRVTEIDEKPEGPVDTNRINAGVYGFSPAIFDAIRATNATGELAITATLNDLTAENELTALGYDGRWLDVSNLWDVLTVNAALIHDSDHAREAPATGQRIGDTVTVAGDVVLAGNVRVGPNATLNGATAIGSNVTVAANAVVENSVVFPDAVIGPGAVVRDAVVAGNAQIGSNATVTGGLSTVVVGDAVHRDVTLGGVVGDNAAIGGGATLTDGAVVGDDVRADAGCELDGDVTDAPGGRVDEHSLAALQVAFLEERAPGGQSDHRYGRGRAVRERRRFADDVGGRNRRVFGVGLASVGQPNEADRCHEPEEYTAGRQHDREPLQRRHRTSPRSTENFEIAMLNRKFNSA